MIGICTYSEAKAKIFVGSFFLLEVKEREESSKTQKYSTRASVSLILSFKESAETTKGLDLPEIGIGDLVWACLVWDI